MDALGGLIGRVTDEAGIQFRLLNRRKGPAVRSPRAQIDGALYSRVLRRYLESCPNLTIVEAGVAEILSEPLRDGLARCRVTGVRLSDGREVRCPTVVVAAGTFLRGLMHTGDEQTAGGRVGEAAANALSDSLRALGLQLGRLKTGTPPRVARETVDFSKLREQPGDAEPYPFSFMTERVAHQQVSCWLSSTTPEIHEIIRASLDRAPLYTGQIGSAGPRYCPSIETKVVRFPEKTSHQLFLEPEGRDSEWIYVNGISTSLPRDVQAEIVRRVPGLETARIVQWGYAVEYDFVPPEQTDATMMAKGVRGLFLAGQINGTSGYEEAAGQGLVAGVNAVRLCNDQALVTIGRDQAYIGVMADDLVTRGVIEPYRMFTSRAEHRMHLRCDNADARLTPLGREWGLVCDERWRRFQATQDDLNRLLATLGTVRHTGRTLQEWLKRPEDDGRWLLGSCEALAPWRERLRTWERAVISVKYEGYIARQERMLAQFRDLESRELPATIRYDAIPHLRREALERWSAVRPRNVGQAARISGIHPTDITVLLVYLGGLARDENASAGAV